MSVEASGKAFRSRQVTITKASEAPTIDTPGIPGTVLKAPQITLSPLAPSGFPVRRFLFMLRSGTAPIGATYTVIPYLFWPSTSYWTEGKTFTPRRVDLLMPQAFISDETGPGTGLYFQILNTDGTPFPDADSFSYEIGEL